MIDPQPVYALVHDLEVKGFGLLVAAGVLYLAARHRSLKIVVRFLVFAALVAPFVVVPNLLPWGVSHLAASLGLPSP